MSEKQHRLPAFVASFVLLILSLSVLTSLFYTKRARSDLETAIAGLTEQGYKGEATLQQLLARLQQSELVLARLENDQLELRDRIGRNSAKTEDLEKLLLALSVSTGSAALDLAEAAAVPVAAEVDPLSESAKAAALEVVAASTYPFLTFDELPPELQQEFQDWKDRAVFIGYPENRWGLTQVGRIAYSVRGEHGAQREYLDPEKSQLMQRLGELSYDIEATIEAQIDELHRKGMGTRFGSKAEAQAYMRTLVIGNRGSYLRVDPSTGEAWVFPPDSVLDYPPLVDLYEQRGRIGSQLLNGRPGSYGVKWKHH